MRKTKKIKIILISLLILYTLTGCYKEEIQYNFPLSEVDIKSALKNEGINWKISEVDSSEDGLIVYTFENENEDLICSIASNSLDEIKMLQLQFYPSENQNDFKTVLGHLKENDWKKVINLASKLYGKKNISKNTLEDLKVYVDKNKVKELNEQYNERIEDTHIFINLKASRDTELGYDLKNIMIMNNASYENLVNILAVQWKKNLMKLGTSFYENTSLSEISKEINGCNEIRYLIVQGYLSIIQDVEEEDIPTNKIENIVTSLDPNDYMKATLKDSSGAIKVICMRNAFTIDELSKVRQHCITYIPDEDIYLLQISASNQDSED